MSIAEFPIISGCMRMAGLSVNQAEALVLAALEQGINQFDHADIYGAGESEALFGQVLTRNPGLRDKIFLQDKCGIRQGCYDFTYDHILSSVDGMLRRLQTDHLDMLLFHRPDALAEQEEFSRAVQELKAGGKVLSFGVSNMNPMQIELLESWCGETLKANQVQLSLMHAGLVTSGMNVNVPNREGTMYDGSLLPYLQKTGKTLQAWSPLQYGMFLGTFLHNPKFPELNKLLDELAETYHTNSSAIAIAWILRIPGSIQAILGTMNTEHLKLACQAAKIHLSHNDWYRLYTACGYSLP